MCTTCSSKAYLQLPHKARSLPRPSKIFMTSILNVWVAFAIWLCWRVLYIASLNFCRKHVFGNISRRLARRLAHPGSVRLCSIAAISSLFRLHPSSKPIICICSKVVYRMWWCLRVYSLFPPCADAWKPIPVLGL